MYTCGSARKVCVLYIYIYIYIYTIICFGGTRWLRRVSQHNHLGSIATEWYKVCLPKSRKGAYRRKQLKGKTLHSPRHGAAGKNLQPDTTLLCGCVVWCARNAMRVRKCFLLKCFLFAHQLDEDTSISALSISQTTPTDSMQSSM